MSHTVDPLSIEETNLVNELLFGTPNNDDNHSCISNKSSVASASASSSNKRSKSIVQDGIDATTVISMDGDSSIGNGSGTLLSTQIQRDSWALGGGGDESATSTTSDCCSASVVSTLTEFKTTSGDDQIIIPPPVSSSTTATSTSKGKGNNSSIVIPDVYIKNKKLIEEADHSRFKKTFKELSEMKMKKNKLLKSSDVQKHLDHLALSLMKDNNNQTTTAAATSKKKDNDDDFPAVDIVASLNGIHVICYNILQESKYTKHPKIVALCFSILSSLAKTTISKKYDNDRRALIANEHGVLVILSCMQKFNISKELLVYEEGVVALYNIIQHIDNAIEFVEMSSSSSQQVGLNIILQTMKTHNKRISIQKSCLGILLRLAHVDFLYIAKQDVFTICVSNLKKSCAIKNGQASLQKVGCLFWKRLMTLAVGSGEGGNSNSNSDQNIHEIKLMIQCGVPEYLLESLKQFGINDSSIASNVIATFTMLSECQLIKERTVLLLNLSDIIKLILKHKTDVNTQRESLKLIRTLQGLPVGSLKLSRSLINDSDVRRLFQMSQINPNQLLPL